MGAANRSVPMVRTGMGYFAVFLYAIFCTDEAAARKRVLVWVYGNAGGLCTPNDPNQNATFAGLAAHTDSFNAVAPQMYTVGCTSSPSRPGCTPIVVSGSSDKNCAPDPALATRFHDLGVEYWPTLSSPDMWGPQECQPPSCHPNETATMKDLLAHPEGVITTALD